MKKQPKRRSDAVHVTHLRVYPEDGRLYEAMREARRPGVLIKTLAAEALAIRAGAERPGGPAYPAPDASSDAQRDDATDALTDRVLASLGGEEE